MASDHRLVRAKIHFSKKQQRNKINSKTTSMSSKIIGCNSEKFRETLTKIMSNDRERPDEVNHDIDKMNQKLMKQLRQEAEKVGKSENKRTDKLNTTTKALMEKR
ncbi:hypothetical protein HHI36_001705 [Cryptolaemus montrouzieri]|uniref:Uncharacterized protein n=1 Tax=Cryptolaemus montrouzieri TaxID=559131 RepID=A0ABD2P931_9CUCU